MMKTRLIFKKFSKWNHQSARNISLQRFDYKDPFLIESQLTKDEKMIKNVVYDFAQNFLLPIVKNSFRTETFDKNIIKAMGDIGLLGPTINEYGCAGVNYVFYGLIMREI